MQDKELIQKIKLLKNISPNENWVISCRSKLAFRMEMERKQSILNKDLFTLKELFSFWQNPQSVFKAVYSFALIAVVVLGGGVLTAFGAMNSLPGTPLYPIKIAMEKARVVVSFSSENKIKLQAEMTDRRIQELNTVVGSQESLEQKSEKIGVVVSQLQEQLATAKNELPEVFNVKESKKMVDAARTMGEKAEQVEKTLARVKEILPQDVKQNMSDKLSAVAETASKTSTKAIEFMANSESDKKEVAAKVESRIQQTEEKIKIVGQKIGNSTATSTSDKLPITAVLIDQSEKVQKLVDEARINMDKNDVSAALETLKAATEIMNSTEKIADNVIADTNSKADNANKESAGNATTSTVQTGSESGEK